MTTCSSLIQDAFREGNLIPVGKSPTVDEQVEALRALNRYVLGVFGFEMGEQLTDWLVPAPQRTAPVAANYPQGPFCDSSNLLSPQSAQVWPYPPKNSRLVFGSVDCTVFFPESPEDGTRMSIVQGSGAGDAGADGQVLTLDGNGRLIEGQAQLTFTAPLEPRQWLYRADTGIWEAITELELTDECPFPEDVDDFWICSLAMRLAPRYNKITAKETENTAIRTLARLKAKYRQAGVTIYGSDQFPRSLQSYISGRWFW